MMTELERFNLAERQRVASDRLLEQHWVERIFIFGTIPVILMQLLENYVSTTIIQTLNLFCFTAVFYYLLKIKHAAGLQYPRGYARVLFVALAAIVFWILYRVDWPAFPGKAFFLKWMSPQIISYLVPFIILLTPCYRHFDAILHTFYKLSLLVIPLWAVSAGELIQDSFYGESIGVYLPIFCGFLLGFLDRFNKKQRIVILTLLSIYFLLMMLNARRNICASIAIYFLISYVCYSTQSVKRMFFTTLVSLVAIVMVYNNWDLLTTEVFSRIYERGLEDTRSMVDEEYLFDLYISPPEVWFFGKGAEGTYYMEFWDWTTEEIIYDRDIIETGYFNMMLKGGLVFVVTILLFLFYAIKHFLARVKLDRHNLFIGLFLCTFLIDLYMTMSLSVHGVKLIIFWFLVAVAYQQNQNPPEEAPEKL